MDRVECVVIGAGVIGLAVARALAMSGREVIVLESTSLVGSEVSSRNSGVIHAGIYYPKDSVRARVCVAGKHALYDYCAEHGVSHRRTGKLIVATEEPQLAALGELAERARSNGVDDLVRLDARDAAELEPAVRCHGALLSPSTGIIDVHEYMLALEGDAEAHGAMLAFNSPCIGGEIGDDGIRVDVGGAEPVSLLCETVVNCAALGAQRVAHSLRGMPREAIPPLYYAKGNYFALTGKSPFNRLIYPMPSGSWLGVHVTLDLAGRCRFGPDIHWIDTLDYDVDPVRLDDFYASIRRYWPGLPDGALQPDYTGIRPKLTPEGAPPADFVIQGEAEHGVPGLINLFGIESPGLTSSLAIADVVVRMADASETTRAETT